jgi:hypothetical protein
MKFTSPALRRLFTLSLLSLAAGCTEPDPDGSIASLDGSKIFGGDLQISGLVDLPPGVPDGSPVQISLTGSGADFAGSLAGPAGVTDGDSLAYQITSLRGGGEYTLWIRVDATGDGNFGQPDDVEGFYNGTVEEPVKLIEEADVVDLTTTSADGVDFGIGKVIDVE